MTDDQQKTFDLWTKEQIYEAFVLEYQTRIRLNKQLNETRLELIKLKYDLKQLLN